MTSPSDDKPEVDTSLDWEIHRSLMGFGLDKSDPERFCLCTLPTAEAPILDSNDRDRFNGCSDGTPIAAPEHERDSPPKVLNGIEQ